MKEKKTFYAISGDVHPDTGLDARSGKKLPYYASQIGSFNRSLVTQEAGLWTSQVRGREGGVYVRTLHMSFFTHT